MTNNLNDNRITELELEVLTLTRKLRLSEENTAIALGMNEGLEIRNSELENLYVESMTLAQEMRENVAFTKKQQEMAWRPFPLDVLPARVRDFVQAHALAKNCDPAFIAAPALGVMAAAVGNSYSIQLKRSWCEISALWIVMVASSGSYKSPGMDAAVAPIHNLEGNAHGRYKIELRQYKNDLEQYKSHTGKEGVVKPEKPVRRRFVTSDTTLESFVLNHSQNQRGVLVSRDEIAGFFGSFDKYKNGASSDMQSWIEMHGGKPITVDRKTSEVPVIHLTKPNASIIGGIQPGVLKSLMSSQFFNSGFVARMLMVEPPQKEKEWSDDDVDEKISASYEQLIEALYAVEMVPEGAMPNVLKLSVAAKDKWVSYYNEHAILTQQLPDGALRSAMTKMEFMAARFALVLQLAEDPDVVHQEVDGEVMAKAIKLARWFRRETARIYQKQNFGRNSLNELQRVVLELPNPFQWQDLEKKKGLKRSGAYKKIRKMLKMNYIAKIAENQYAHRIFPELIDWSSFEGQQE